MHEGIKIRVEEWALDGEPFRLAAVAVGAAEWERELRGEAREKVGRYVDGQARARAGASEWLKGVWLPGELGMAAEFELGANGKPLLKGAAAEWGFNLTHAGEWAVAALVRGKDVGVDLETMDRRADVEGIARKVFSESERELAAAGGREAFFALWSRKEALMKALGCGWADGKVQRRTRLNLEARQLEPATGASVWWRRVEGGRYALAVALAERRLVVSS